jgi:hypothetical protein
MIESKRVLVPAIQQQAKPVPSSRSPTRCLLVPGLKARSAGAKTAPAAR